MQFFQNVLHMISQCLRCQTNLLIYVNFIKIILLILLSILKFKEEKICRFLDGLFFIQINQKNLNILEESRQKYSDILQNKNEGYEISN